MSDSTFFPEDRTGPTNLAISTPPGIGTYVQLVSELMAKGSNYFNVSGAHGTHFDLVLSVATGEIVLADGLESADTIVVDEAEKMSPSLRELVEELIQSRSLGGRKLDALKDVVIVYTRNEEDPFDPDLLDIHAGYTTVLIVK